MIQENAFSDLADFFRLFGDTTRIQILCALFDREFAVGELAEKLNMTQSAISHQLKILKQGRLVRNRREGRAVFYALADEHVKTIIHQGMEHISE